MYLSFFLISKNLQLIWYLQVIVDEVSAFKNFFEYYFFCLYCIVIPFDIIVSYILTFHLILDNEKIFEGICLTVSISKIKNYQRQR